MTVPDPNDDNHHREISSNELDLSLDAVMHSYFEARENGETAANWANNFPAQEYRLWLLSRPDNADLGELARKRLHQTEKLRITRRIAIGASALYAAGINAAFISIAIAEGRPAYLLGIIPTAVLWGPAIDYSVTNYRQLPQLEQIVETERENYRQVFPDSA